MIDYHCHLDLYKSPMSVYEESKQRKIKILAVTTSPKAYVKAIQHFSDSKEIVVALGFHPELVADRINEKELFIQLMSASRYIGEIGIDGYRQNSRSLSIQASFFHEALLEAEKRGGRILSIHSRGAVKKVLDIIDKTSNANVSILHWFTGSKSELERAVAMHCWFSINPKMCLSKSGQETIKGIPINKLLPETEIGRASCRERV